MQSDNPKKFYRLIDCALIALMAGFLLAVFFIDESAASELIFWLSVEFCGLLLVLFFVLTGRTRYIFFGIVFTTNAACVLVALHFCKKVYLKDVWPLVGIFFSIAFVVTGFCHYKKFILGYLIPAVLLFVMSLIFMLFSMHIITVSIKDFALLFLILCVIAIVCWFFIQKKIEGDKKSE